MKKWDVFVHGDINIDLVVPGVERLPLPGQENVTDTMDTYVGGGAALFALGLGKLGVKTAFKGLIGDDVYGRFIKEELTKHSIDCSRLGVSKEYKTGISICFTNKHDRSFLTYRGTNAEINITDIPEEDIRHTRHIHITGYAGREKHQLYMALLQNIRSFGDVTVSLDVGWDDSGEWYEGIFELLPYISVLFMNETEAVHYSHAEDAEAAATMFGKHCPLVALKLGEKGSMAVTGDTFHRAPSYPVRAVDTTGAGDSFNAGFIYGYLRGGTITDCLRYGNACGAMSVQALGGNTGFPTERELLDFTAERKADVK